MNARLAGRRDLCEQRREAVRVREGAISNSIALTGAAPACPLIGTSRQTPRLLVMSIGQEITGRTLKIQCILKELLTIPCRWGDSLHIDGGLEADVSDRLQIANKRESVGVDLG